MRFSELFEGQATVPFTCLQAVADVVGKDNIATDKKNIKPNQFLVTNVDMGSEWNVIPDEVKKENPHMFRGGQTKARHFAGFQRRTDYDNMPDPLMKNSPDYKHQPYMGDIVIPHANSKDAADVASAVHEAYHAWIFSRSKGGQAYANEKMVNQQAEKWLRKHISGMALHVALEAITDSRINYGHNKE